MILSFLYPQFNIYGYIYYITLTYSSLTFFFLMQSGGILERSILFFFFVFSFVENKKRRNVSLDSPILIWITAIWIAFICIAFIWISSFSLISFFSYPLLKAKADPI